MSTLSREDEHDGLLGIDPAVHVEGPRLPSVVHRPFGLSCRCVRRARTGQKHLRLTRYEYLRPIEERAAGHLSGGSSDPSQS